MDDPEVHESKPDVDVKLEDETQPDPDEIMDMQSGNGRAWCVKVPKHLMEKWAAINRDGVHLATLRAYDPDPRTGKPRFVLFVPVNPPHPSDPSATEAPPLVPGTYEEYELDMINQAVENQIVVAEKEVAPGSRARSTILTGRIKHECSMRPKLTDAYRQRLKKRAIAASTPRRTAKVMDVAEAGGVGRMNRLGAGMGTPSSAFAGLVKPKPKPAKGTFERFARMPRNQLLDLLFALYRERPRWSAKDLRSRTEQPEAYLKEVLGEIADLHRSGEFNGLYELKANFKDSVKSENGEYSGAAGELMKAEPDADAGVDDEPDDDEDEDMEEVS
ncbi:transcription initiation factor IIF, beta subunit [Sanghuangporus baumii]|uniref:Transcription initiation factor IIF subunit beta n=1 Tax=Sanghuangporus baumii TaxID=108892 RepID=A0A9Q5I409_SANBA|nr:transcription initiation factor IIF, beta subunit [Sanghuangporus baumii]